MNAKRVVISCGPIPARVDSVKYITNRFKGQLAFRTAEALIQEGFRVTIVKWEHTPLPRSVSNWLDNCEEVVDVQDVFDYYSWFEAHAAEYDAFVMAAAVANLTPVAPWKGKFPSHLYQPGETFPIEFQIAPRAIDVIKRKNPRCCLIGYKLFDAPCDKELIEVAEHTLKDSKANIIFANTPATAKDRKIALMQDGSRIKMTFDTHIKFMIEAIKAECFETVVQPLLPDEEKDPDIKRAYAIVEMFEKTFPGYGTVAVPVPGDEKFVVTTSRGHKAGPVLIRDVDMNKGIIYATDKATLNAATMHQLLLSRLIEYGTWENNVILVHRHIDDPRNNTKKHAVKVPYVFPGSTAEFYAIHSKFFFNLRRTDLRVIHHGDYCFRQLQPVDWSSYYEDFPERYFKTPPEMQAIIDRYRGTETLEVGGNIKVDAKYAWDPYVEAENAENLALDEVLQRHFDLIIARNSINYLCKGQIKLLLDRTDHFVANTFLVAPEKKVTDQEAAVREDNGFVQHALLLPNDDVATHEFWAYTREDYEALGFTVTPYGKNSALLTYDAEGCEKTAP